MTTRTGILTALTFVFLVSGYGLTLVGLSIMPDGLPPTELASWLHPGTLTVLAGFMGLAMSVVPLLLANPSPRRP